MPLRLRDNLHWCECGGRIVFLDAAADRYFGLPATVRHAFLALAAGKARSSDIEHLNILADRGLLVEGQSGQPFQAPAAIDPPVHDILTDPVPRSRVVPILRALVWELRAGWELRTRPLSEVIALTGRFSSVLHPPVQRAVRLVLLLRTFDAMEAGASQFEIADELLSKNLCPERWRVHSPSLRSRAQRLVRTARNLGRGAFWQLLG